MHCSCTMWTNPPVKYMQPNLRLSCMCLTGICCSNEHDICSITTLHETLLSYNIKPNTIHFCLDTCNYVIYFGVFCFLLCFCAAKYAWVQFCCTTSMIIQCKKSYIQIEFLQGPYSVPLVAMCVPMNNGDFVIMTITASSTCTIASQSYFVICAGWCMCISYWSCYNSLHPWSYQQDIYRS